MTATVADVVAGHAAATLLRPDGALAPLEEAGGVVVPGSFNPLHEGHLRLAAAAEALTAHPAGTAVFELAVHNVDKPTLTVEEVQRRLAQFRGRAAVAVTAAPRFVDKAALLPGRLFAVGYDTALRLLDPAYHGGRAARDAALVAIARTGCRVAVAGRLHDGAFRTLADLPLADVPAAARGLFVDVVGFRVDVSSTLLRAARRTSS